MTPSRALALVLILTAARASTQTCPYGETERRIVTCKEGAAMDECHALARRVGCNVVRDLPSIHALVVEIAELRVYDAEAELAAAPAVERVDADRKVRWLHSLPSRDFSLPDMSELTENLRKIKSPAAAGPEPEMPWGVKRVGAADAWARTQGEGVKVAVIDTGIDAAHPDLAGQVAGGFNALSGAKPDAWKDDEGHGTHVAGTIAAKRDGTGVVGVAPKARLYAVKVLDKDGNGNYSDVIAGIEWAAAQGIKVANMSLGADEGSEPLHRAVQAALKAGLTIVAAAGNSGGKVGYPGAYAETIAVGASDVKDKVAAFSSRGAEVDFIAPGVDILSDKLGGGTVKLSGTSMATPHMTGLAALAVGAGAASPSAIRAALTRAAKPLAGLTPAMQGSGLVLAGNLLRPGTRGDDGGSRFASLTR